MTIGSSDVMRSSAPSASGLDLGIARLLRIATVVSVTLLAVGVGLMIVTGVSPLEPNVPPLDLARVPADIAGLRPEGPLWLGLLALIATPVLRVAAGLVGYVRLGEAMMIVVSCLILAVIGVAVVIGLEIGIGTAP